MSTATKGTWTKFIDEIEETIIAVILGLMTLITFANVIARYVFNSNILWALELTVFLFAWLVLIGASYCVKHSVHLGVDIVIDAVPPRVRQAMALLAVTACLAFTILLFKGSWDYWYAFATKRAFLETNDIPMPGFLQFLADWFNDGEKYEKIPRFIPYFALPLGLGLMTFRYIQVALQILRGETDRLIEGHEVEDAINQFVTDSTPKKEG